MAPPHQMAFVVYCSPAGATRHVAQIIDSTLRSLGNEVIAYDLGRDRDVSSLLSHLSRVHGKICLYVGSPVYASHATPPIMEFITELPDVVNGYAVPFVTWGGASSGIALYEMGHLCGNVSGRRAYLRPLSGIWEGLHFLL